MLYDCLAMLTLYWWGHNATVMNVNSMRDPDGVTLEYLRDPHSHPSWCASSMPQFPDLSYTGNLVDM